MKMTNVDLQKYTGTWYEIERNDNYFQRKCTRNAEATYTLLDDGYIRIQNSCMTKRGKRSITGYAWSVSDNNRHLKVHFFNYIPRKFLSYIPFAGNYHIYYVSSNYRVAIVVSNNKYWILSRTRCLHNVERYRKFLPPNYLRT